MAFTLPKLPYAKSALAPHISAGTLEFHHGKHHRKYVDTLNELVRGTQWEGKPLEEIILGSDPGPLYENAAQHWNHSFYWKCLAPSADEDPSGNLLHRLRTSFGDVDGFRREFNQAATAIFGSGWAWLVVNPSGSLAIEVTANADNPLLLKSQALLTCDMWEHAYYIDRHNEKAKYLDAFWQVVNWEFVESQLAGATASASAEERSASARLSP